MKINLLLKTILVFVGLKLSEIGECVGLVVLLVAGGITACLIALIAPGGIIVYGWHLINSTALNTFVLEAMQRNHHTMFMTYINIMTGFTAALLITSLIGWIGWIGWIVCRAIPNWLKSNWIKAKSIVNNSTDKKNL